MDNVCRVVLMDTIQIPQQTYATNACLNVWHVQTIIPVNFAMEEWICMKVAVIQNVLLKCTHIKACVRIATCPAQTARIRLLALLVLIILFCSLEVHSAFKALHVLQDIFYWMDKKSATLNALPLIICWSLTELATDTDVPSINSKGLTLIAMISVQRVSLRIPLSTVLVAVIHNAWRGYFLV